MATDYNIVYYRYTYECAIWDNIYIYDTIIIHEHDKVAMFVIFPMYPNTALEGTANIS